MEIEILMIDDDKDNYDSLKNFAARQNIYLRYSKSLEEGLVQLKENDKILGLILDGKGFITAVQEKGSESSNFVHEALTKIALFESENNVHFAKVVYTAWYEQLLDSVSGRAEIYDKKKLSFNENLKMEMFSKLKSISQDSKQFKIRNKFSRYFELMDNKYLPSSQDKKLFNLLYQLDENKSNFNELRNLLEGIFKRLNASDLNIIPNSLFHQDGRPNLGWIIQYLKGEKITDFNKNILYEKLNTMRVPNHIAYTIEFLKQLTSAISHDYREKVTINSFKGAIFSLFEIFEWLKTEIDLIDVDPKIDNSN
jgi:hypothetical protein